MAEVEEIDPEVARTAGVSDADARLQSSIAELIGRSDSVSSTPTPAELNLDGEHEKDLLEVISTAENALKAVRGRAEVVQCIALMKEAEQEKETRRLKNEQERLAAELSMFRQQLADKDERNKGLLEQVQEWQKKAEDATRENQELAEAIKLHTSSGDQFIVLPDDLVLKIMGYLSPEDIASFAQVSRRTRHLALEMDMQHVYDEKKRLEMEIGELKSAKEAAMSPLITAQRSPGMAATLANEGDIPDLSAQKSRSKFAPANVLSGLLGGRNSSHSVDAGAKPEKYDNILDHLKVEMFEAQIAYLGKQLKEQQELVAAAKSEGDDAMQKLATADATKEFVVGKMKEAEKKAIEAESARDEAWALNKELAESKDELQRKVEALEAELAGQGVESAEKSIHQQADVEALKERVNVLEDLLGLAKADKDDAVSQLQSQKKILVKEVKALRSQLEEVKTERDRHLAALRHLEQSR